MNVVDYAKGFKETLSLIDNCGVLLKQANHEKTLAHVIKVSQAGVKIAHDYNLDKNKVEIACYLHDISAIIPRTDYVTLCEASDIEVLAVERKLPMLLHQKVSRLIAEEIFKITDAEILSAIEVHTTLKDKPSDIDMAVFIADKLAWDQEGIPPFFDCVAQSIKISLEKACLGYINYCLEHEMIKIPHPMLLAAKNDLERMLLDKH